MAPGRAADVSQDSARCRADSEPAGSARPDEVKPMYMYGRERGGVEPVKGLSHIKKDGGGKFVTVVTHQLICTVSDRHHTHSVIRSKLKSFTLLLSC